MDIKLGHYYLVTLEETGGNTLYEVFVLSKITAFLYRVEVTKVLDHENSIFSEGDVLEVRHLSFIEYVGTEGTGE